MLRIHFTGQDLARIRMAPTPDPMWELTLSMHALRKRATDPLLGGWRKDLAELLRPGNPVREQMQLLFELNPPHGYFPDFLTPAESADGFGAGLDAVLATPRAQLRLEVSALGADRRTMGAAAQDVGKGKGSALGQLGVAMTRYHDVAIAPVWDRVRTAFEADRSLRARTMLDGSVGAMLDGIHPRVRFDGGVLEIIDYPRERDLHLGGRGLVLIPSYFKCPIKPITLADPDLPPVLVYPIDRTVRVAASTGREPLAALLGSTRAALLELAAVGGSTTELARQLAISPATASEHLTVLRQAGLTASLRARNSVRHTLTPLGYAMLRGR